MCSLLYTFISFERKKTARAEAFQPGHLTWRALASRRHWLDYTVQKNWVSHETHKLIDKKLRGHNED